MLRGIVCVVLLAGCGSSAQQSPIVTKDGGTEHAPMAGAAGTGEAGTTGAAGTGEPASAGTTGAAGTGAAVAVDAGSAGSAGMAEAGAESAPTVVAIASGSYRMRWDGWCSGSIDLGDSDGVLYGSWECVSELGTEKGIVSGTRTGLAITLKLGAATVAGTYDQQGAMGPAITGTVSNAGKSYPFLATHY